MNVTDRRRGLLVVLGLLSAGSLAAAAAVPASAASTVARTDATFSAAPADPASPVATAVTYDPAQVPVGAGVSVHAVAVSNGRTMITLHVRGLLPDESYGAHAHYRACGAVGGAAGAHYQDVPDPSVGGSETVASVDPAYANPDNEVWLDLQTNGAGNGHAKAVVDWQFRPSVARGVVLHLNPTSTGGAGQPPAGNAGARLACVTVGL